MKPDRSVLINESWRQGLLRWKLYTHQRPIYEAVWKVINNDNPSLRFVINCARRFGKTTTLLVIAIEYCIRNKNSQIRYAAPTLVQLRKMVNPIFRSLIADCPEEFKPQFCADHVVRFPNGSEIHFAGTDNQHAENLRGQTSHLNILDEAGSMTDLDYLITSILTPQTLTTGGKTILASTPPVEPEHDYVDIYQEATEEGNLVEFTIHDNKSITPEILQIYMKEAGGETSAAWQREYLCKFVTETEKFVIPEWKEQYITVPDKTEYYSFFHKYTSLDTGVRDFTAVLYGYYNFKAAQLIIEDEFTINGPQMTTDILAKKIKEQEKVLWPNIKPFRRISDNTNLMLIQDMNYLHQLPFIMTTKEQLEAMVNETRIWIKSGKVLVNPKCVQLIGCLKHAIWKDKRAKMEFGRSKKFGHYDHLASLIYLIRNIDTFTNPIPITYATDIRRQHIDPNMVERAPVSQDGRVLERLFFGNK